MKNSFSEGQKKFEKNFSCERGKFRKLLKLKFDPNFGNFCSLKAFK